MECLATHLWVEIWPNGAITYDCLPIGCLDSACEIHIVNTNHEMSFVCILLLT